MKISIPLVFLLCQVSAQTNPNHYVVHHPSEHPFEPVYVRKYIVSDTEIDQVAACKTDTHDCDYAVFVFLREEGNLKYRDVTSPLFVALLDF